MVAESYPIAGQPSMYQTLIEVKRTARSRSWHAKRGVTACQVARPPARIRLDRPAFGDFYFQAFNGSVSLSVAGYNYNSGWISFCWRDSHPLEWQLASLHGQKPEKLNASKCFPVFPKKRTSAECAAGGPSFQFAPIVLKNSKVAGLRK
jgi:hypothetical protein